MQSISRAAGRAPQPAAQASAQWLHIPDESPALGLNPLEAAASHLLRQLTRLRSTPEHSAPMSLRAQLLDHLRHFEAHAVAAGVARNEVLLARYALCTALDEAVLSTSWGSQSDWGKQSLLITLHNEAWGGEKVFQLLEHCLRSPRERLSLLELLYLCLCLGFEGRYRVMNDGRSQLEALRAQTSAAIRSARGEYERELSPHWRGLAVVRDRLPPFVPLWASAAAGLALLLFVLFGLRLKLASDAEPVFKRIQALGEIPVQTITPVVAQPTLIERPRLAQLLEADIKARRVIVEDAVDRSVVTIRGDELFFSGSAIVVDDYQPLMLRIADAIRKLNGHVRVAGHSDNRPIATQRFPSNWTLSHARAEQVLQILAAKTGQPERFSAEGRGDTEPLASNTNAEGRARNRRVEITVLAEGVE